MDTVRPRNCERNELVELLVVVVHEHSSFSLHWLQAIHGRVLNVVLICLSLLWSGNLLAHRVWGLGLKARLRRKDIKGYHCVETWLLNIFGAISNQEKTPKFWIFVVDVHKDAHFGLLGRNLHNLPLRDNLLNFFLQIGQPYIKASEIMFKLVDTNLLFLQGIQEVLFARFLVYFEELVKNGKLNHPDHLYLLRIHFTWWNQIQRF